ncbi:hypothetical protein KCP77_00285 [Salmonella enterica subsp. enterica]|nr:hypothetical protein KCP77_00285 [Salmonella enterica subsp. enterica]
MPGCLLHGNDARAEQLLPVLQRYGFETLESGLMAFWVNTALENYYFKFPLVSRNNSL